MGYQIRLPCIWHVAYIIEMPGLKMPGRYLPIITIAFVTPFWVIRVKSLFERKKALEAGQIMDLGFRFGGDPAAEKRRAIRYISSVGLLFVAVWIFGFHIALPIWVMTYLFVFARVKPIIILLIGAAFEGLLLGIHDFIIDPHAPPSKNIARPSFLPSSSRADNLQKAIIFLTFAVLLVASYLATM